MDFKQIVNDLPIGKLISTDDDIFWYTSSKFEKRYKHENGKVNDIFYDGNNGDKWKVLAINTELRRIIVQNVSQNYLSPRYIYW